MKENKSSKLAIRLEPKEKKLLTYYADRLGLSPSAIVRNQIKSLLSNLEEQLSDTYYSNVVEMSAFNGPNFSQEEIEKLFEVENK